MSWPRNILTLCRRGACLIACLLASVSSAAASSDGPTGERTATTNTWEATVADRMQWWSLQPVRPAPVPEVRNASWPANDVDRFLLARLESAGLHPAPPAAPVTLVRRLTFTLTGLPPTPAEVAEFEAGAAHDIGSAVRTLVDRLLASPHFGERWARHWMDVVRYGDTYGYEWDIPAKGAWRFRDYLIRAFHADVPFDQLVREHIAGDLLESPRVDSVRQINESVIGTMFLRLGENRHGDSAMFDGIHQEMIDNQIDALGKAFQATTIACARCHDHKLDAVSQRDYYALAGVLMSSRWVTRTADLPGRNARTLDQLRALKRQLRPILARVWLHDVRLLAGEMTAALRGESPLPDSDPDPARLTRWRELSDPAAPRHPPLEDPLHPWSRLLEAAHHGCDPAATWEALRDDYERESSRRAARNQATFTLVADFTRGLPDGWSVDGTGLTDGPGPAGDFTVALDGAHLVSQILPAGLHTHRWSPRLNGAIRTPYLNLWNRARVSIEGVGGDFAAHRIVVDNAFLAERQEYLRARSPAWFTFSTFPEMKERRIYVELATKGSNGNFPPRVGLGGACNEEQAADPRSWLGVTRVVLHDRDGRPEDDLRRFHTLFAGPTPASLEEAAHHLAAWWGSAVEAWAAGNPSDDDATLLRWLLDQGFLSNRRGVPVAEPAEALVTRYEWTERDLVEPETINGMADLEAGYDYRFHVRGDYEQRRDPVPRGYVAAISPATGRLNVHGSGRAELAAAIATPANPLTARVWVNRVWSWVFGTGLVATPNDFGRLGEPPSHPDLLDHLAHRFVADGWSTKRLVRELVLTSAFRQSATPSATGRQRDPDNRLLHHFPARRLEAEAIRDAMLAVSGRIDPRLYGPPIDPHRASEDPQKRLFSGPVDGLGRRSIYTRITLMEPPRFLATFNQPNPKIPTGRRDVTHVPAQALALLNDPFVLNQAAYWARELVCATDTSVESRLARMFRSALSRNPTPAEIARWTETARQLADARAAADDPLTSVDVWKDVAHALFNTREFLYLP